MIVLSGADLVLPDRILTPGTLVIDGDRIADIRPGAASGRPAGHAGSLFAFHGHYIVPGFVDVHVHGVDGTDALDGDGAVAAIAARLPRYGVTAFCPTTIACAPGALRLVLAQVRAARETRDAARRARAARASREQLPQPGVPRRAARAVPAHGARGARRDADVAARRTRSPAPTSSREIERAAPDVGIVTIAPEIDGGLELVAWLASRGHRVSLGHSGATYDQALAAIAAGARQATHLFNRMPAARPPRSRASPAPCSRPTTSPPRSSATASTSTPPSCARRSPPSGPSRVMAITDGTAASGLPVGRRASLGGQPITVGESAAFLDDGTIAGSVLTMDRAFQMLVGRDRPVARRRRHVVRDDAGAGAGAGRPRRAGARRRRRPGRARFPAVGRADLRRRTASSTPARTSRRPIPSKRAEEFAMTHPSRVPVAALLSLALAGTACVDIVAAQYVDRQDKRFTVSGTPDVSLSTFDGSIEVRPWDRSEVLVTVEKHARDKADADAIEVHAEQNGNKHRRRRPARQVARLRHPRRLESGAERAADRADAGVGDRGAVERRRLDRHRAHQRELRSAIGRRRASSAQRRVGRREGAHAATGRSSSWA